MLDWDKLRIFHTVAQSGSFTRAGDTLGLSQSAISRQISALEESLHSSLFHRHARGLVLTEQGEILARSVQEMFSLLSRTEVALTDTKERPRGPLKVTAPATFGTSWLTPRLMEFLDLYPDINMSIVADDREFDLSMREADVAIRLFPSRQPELIQRHLFTIRNGVYATPDYLRKHGVPQKPEDLDQHHIVSFAEEGKPPFDNVNWLLKAGANPKTPREPILQINSLFGILKAMKASIGIAGLPDYMVQNQKRVVRILDNVEGPRIDVYFVYTAEMRNSKRVKVFRDFLIRKIHEAGFSQP